MRNGIILLFLAMIVAGILAFSGPLIQYPVFANPYTVTAYEFASFLFWMLLFLFLLALLLSPVWQRRSAPAIEKKDVDPEAKGVYMLTSGFLLAIFFAVISFIAAIFGFGFVASTFGGLAMVVFWIAIILTLVAIAIGLFEQWAPKR